MERRSAHAATNEMPSNEAYHADRLPIRNPMSSYPGKSGSVWELPAWTTRFRHSLQSCTCCTFLPASCFAPGFPRLRGAADQIIG